MARIGRSRPARAYIVKTSERLYLSTTTPAPASVDVQATFPAPVVGVSPGPSTLAVAAPVFASPVRAVTAQPGTLSASAGFAVLLVTIPITPSALTVTASLPAVIPVINASVVAGLTADLPPPVLKLTVPGPAFMTAAAIFGAATISGGGSADVHPSVLALAGAAASPGSVIPQTLAVPAYIYPTGETGSGAWQTMEAAAPQVGIVLINPGSGPGASSNSDYVAETTYMQAAGVKVLGYIHTSYTATSLSTMEGQVDDYYNWYGVDGIFIDEVTTAAGSDQAYYASLYSYTKAKPGGRSNTVIINPGTPPDVSYMSCCDICCNCETDLGSYRVRVPAGWESSYPASRFWHIVYAAGWAGNGTGQMYEALNLAREYNAGYVFITNAYEPNPYDVIPGNPYWSELVAQLATPTGINSPAPVVEDGFDQYSGYLNSQWAVTGTVAISNYQLTVLAQNSYADYCNSTATFNFAGRTASVSAPIVPTTASGEQWMQVVTDGNDYLAIGKSGSSMVFRIVAGGVNPGDTIIAYNATNHLYWGITLTAGGTATWQTSPDGNTWTIQRVMSSGLPSLSAAYLHLLAGHYSSGDADQTVAYDNALVSAPFTATTLPSPAVTCSIAPGVLHAVAATPAVAAGVGGSPAPHTVQAVAALPQAAITISAVVFEAVGATLPAPIVKVTVARATLSQAPVISAATFVGPTVLGGSANATPATLSLTASLPAPIASGLSSVAVVPNWMSNGEYIHRLYDLDPATADFYFNTPTAFSVGTTNSSSPVQDGFLSTPVLRYTSYNTFLADVNSNAINTSIFQWVMYDLEDWADNFIMSTQAECNDPWDYMAYFTTLAHENGFSVILAPGQDLGNDATSLNPKLKGETNQAWYIRTNIAGAAAGTGAEIIEIQDQNNTATLSEFDTFYFNALTQVQAASTTCQVWCGLSTTYGTAAQMLAAYESLLGWCDGIWMNASDATIALMDSFMSSIPVNPPSFAAAAVFVAPNVTAASQPSAFDATAGLPTPTVVLQVNASVSPSALQVTASLPAVAVGLCAIPGPLRGYALLNCFDQLEDEAYAGLMDEAYGPLLEEDLDDVVTVVVTSLSPLGATAVIPQPVLTAGAFPSALALAAAFPVAAVSPGATSLHASATLQTVAPQGPPAGALHAVATFAAIAPVPAAAAASFAATLPTPTLTLTVTSVTALDAVATLRAPGVPAVTPAAAAVTFTSAVVAVTAAPSAVDAVASFPASAPAVTLPVGVLAQPGAAFLTPVVSGQGSPVAVTPLALDAAAALALVAVACSALPAVLAATATFGTPTVVISSTDATPGAFVATPFIPVPALAVTVSPAALSVTATVPVPAAKDAGSPAPLHCAASFPAPAPASRSFPAALNAASNFHVPVVTISATPAALDATITVGGPAGAVTAIPVPLDATAALTPPDGVFIYPAAAQFTVSFPAAVRKVTKLAGTLHASVTIPASRPGGQSPPVAGYVTFPAAAVSTVAAPFGPWCFTTTEQDANQFGGAWTHGNTYGGLWVETNLYGGTESDANPYLGLGIFGYGGSANSGMYNGTADCGCFVTMEAVNITIGEFNDETIDLAITNSGSPFNLNSPQYGLQVLLKTAAGVLDNDPSTVILTSDGENPAITIAAGSNGLATLVIPHDVLETTAFTFWRCDVTTPSGQQATAIYGLVSIKML